MLFNDFKVISSLTQPPDKEIFVAGSIREALVNAVPSILSTCSGAISYFASSSVSSYPPTQSLTTRQNAQPLTPFTLLATPLESPSITRPQNTPFWKSAMTMGDELISWPFRQIPQWFGAQATSLSEQQVNAVVSPTLASEEGDNSHPRIYEISNDSVRSSIELDRFLN